MDSDKSKEDLLNSLDDLQKVFTEGHAKVIVDELSSLIKSKIPNKEQKPLGKVIPFPNRKV